MTLVCIERPNRSYRRVWTSQAVARVARYAAVDLGAAAPVAAKVLHCLGYADAVLCCARETAPIEVVAGGVELRKTLTPARRAIDTYLTIEPRLPRWVRRLLRRITSVLTALDTALRVLDELTDVLDLEGGCTEYRDALDSLAEQLEILQTHEVMCDGPEQS